MKFKSFYTHFSTRKCLYVHWLFGFSVLRVRIFCTNSPSSYEFVWVLSYLFVYILYSHQYSKNKWNIENEWKNISHEFECFWREPIDVEIKKNSNRKWFWFQIRFILIIKPVLTKYIFPNWMEMFFLSLLVSILQ